MEAYTEPVEVANLKPSTIYKVTTPKSVFLAKYQGKNKNELLHFMDQAINRLVVLNPTEHILSVHATK